MTTAAWRRLLLALCAFALLQLGISAWAEVTNFAAIPGLVANSLPGEGAGIATTATPFVDRLTFPRSNPLWRRGLRSGDLVDLRRLTPVQRYRLISRWWWLGERIDLPVIRNGAALTIPLVPQKYDFPIDWQIANVGLAWLILFAALIAWRRPDSAEARVLALLLIGYNIGLTFQSQNWVTPWPALDIALVTLTQPLYYAAFALLATYSLLFARPPSRIRRIAAAAAWCAAAAGCALDLITILAPCTLAVDPFSQALSGSVWALVVNVLPYLVPLVSVALAVHASKGERRSRLIWASVPLAVLFIAFAVEEVPQIVDPGARVPYAFEVLANMGIFVAPLGFTYSLLNRRVLDIGFVVNRAVVYSAVSIIVVGLFVLFEWLASEWLSSAGHVTNLAVSAAFALVLGLSVRAIHAHADRALDTLFFRKRHEDEQAIRTFAREVAYITDAATVVQRTRAVLEEHADASFVTLALADDDFNGAGENDPAIVTMRASHGIVDLHAADTHLRGEFAYPMIARGRLVGALLLGPKGSGESYAPDESDAILQLAHGAAGALDILEAKRETQSDSLAAELRALSLLVADGLQKINDRLDAKELTS